MVTAVICLMAREILEATYRIIPPARWLLPIFIHSYYQDIYSRSTGVLSSSGA